MDLGYDTVNNAFLVREWESGQRYYTADVTFHPMTFPYRSNPDRLLSDLRQYDNFAPHITGGSSLKINYPFNRLPTTEDTEEQVIPLLPRQSRRQLDYTHSGGVQIADIPDAGAFFIHSFGPDPVNMKEARLMYDAPSSGL